MPEEILVTIKQAIDEELKEKRAARKDANFYFKLIQDIAKHIEWKPYDENLEWLYEIFKNYWECGTKNPGLKSERFEIVWRRKNNKTYDQC